tara:strand:- start:29281 stop:29883 length:603 start_codon:yes stop_codon:yes gene_type:complete
MHTIAFSLFIFYSKVMKLIFNNKSLLRITANFLTLLRGVLAVPLIISLESQQFLLAWILILIAGVSDLLDGYLARKAGGGTTWGARLDPLCDKIFICAPLIYLSSKGILPLWAVWLLIARELIISGWRSNHIQGAPASLLGKSKTILQFLSICLIFLPDNIVNYELYLFANKLGLILFWPSLILALLSAYKYIKTGSDHY